MAGRSVTVSSGLGGDPETVVSSRSSSPTRIKTTKAMIAEVSGTVALMLAGGVEGIVTTGAALGKTHTPMNTAFWPNRRTS